MYRKDIEAAWALLNRSEPLYGRQEMEAALDRLGAEISDRLADEFPVVLCVMGGAVVFAGQLLPRLAFPLEFDYIHATRYRDGTRGGEIEWAVLPRKSLAGRTVLLLDCRSPSVRPVSVAALAEELPPTLRVVLWGASPELRSRLLSVSPRCQSWIGIAQDTSLEDLAGRCAILVC